jgi:hypothetical protein
MSLVPDRDVPVRASEEARLLILAQARSLRLALEDLHAARRGGLLTFAAPNPELAGLSDLEMLTLLVRDPTQLPLVPLVGYRRSSDSSGSLRQDLYRVSYSPDHPQDRRSRHRSLQIVS